MSCNMGGKGVKRKAGKDPAASVAKKQKIKAGKENLKEPLNPQKQHKVSPAGKTKGKTFPKTQNGIIKNQNGKAGDTERTLDKSAEKKQKVNTTEIAADKGVSGHGKKLNKKGKKGKKKANPKDPKAAMDGGSKSTEKKADIGRPKKPAPRKPEDYDANWKLLQKLQLVKVGKKPQKTDKKSTAEGSPEKSDKADEPPEIWFDDVDEILLETQQISGKPKVNPLVKPESYEGLTKAVAMDCEMVGVGHEGKDSILARVSLVNQFGQCIYDKYVKNRERVTDFRTFVSGIRPADIAKGEPFDVVQKEVSDILTGRVLVGHALRNDFKVLFLSHPHKMVRDTARFRTFRKLFQGGTPGLKKLTEKVLGVKVQEGEHNSVQDAQAAMRLYTMYKRQWEKELKDKYRPRKSHTKPKKKKVPTATLR